MSEALTFLIAAGLLGAAALGVAILQRVRGSRRERHQDEALQQCGPPSPVSRQDVPELKADKAPPSTTEDDSRDQTSWPSDEEHQPIQIPDATSLPPADSTAIPVAITVDATSPSVSVVGELPRREADNSAAEIDQPHGRTDRAHHQPAVAAEPAMLGEDARPEDRNATVAGGEQVQEMLAVSNLNDEEATNDTAASSREEASRAVLEAETSRDTATVSSQEAVPRPQTQSRPESRKYQGLARRPPRLKEDDRPKSPVAVADRAGRERVLSIEVRLRFDKGGFCIVSLIASRASGLPEDITVAAARGVFDLCAMQDEWYQDIIPEDITRLLREGTGWTYEGATGTWKWLLSGRDLYVLGERTGLTWWVSQPCLQLGRKHVVLCTERLRLEAEEALRATGVDSAVALDASLGAPDGWVVFRDVIPTRPVSRSSEADILNALRPQPEVEISLEGGIRLEDATWLEGCPPLVRVYGDSAHTTEVLIDGRQATRCEDGAYRVPGSDAAGTHTVWCEGTSRSYSVVPFAGSWEPWDAYSFSVASGSNRRLAVCGPLTREISTNQLGWIPAIELPETHTVVLGAAPGEYTLATRASDIRGSPFLASPSFRPVWALPSNPLHCTKTMTRILLVGEAVEPAIPPAIRTPMGRRPVFDAWCRLILDAGRKGLATEPDTERVRTLWSLYKRAARRIWRSRK